MTVETFKTKTLDLFEQYQKKPSIQARNQIAELNIGLVKLEANRWNRLHQGLFDEFFQCGSLGLIKAIERFDPRRKNAFSSFAMYYIRGEIQHYLRDSLPAIRVSRRYLELRQCSNKVERDFIEKFGRHPSSLEVAEHLQITDSEWQAAQLAQQNQNPLSLDAPLQVDERDCDLWCDLIADARADNSCLGREDALWIGQSLDRLEERTREVVDLTVLQDMTIKAAARQLGLTPTTVSRHLKRGLSTLYDLMNVDLCTSLF